MQGQLSLPQCNIAACREGDDVPRANISVTKTKNVWNRRWTPMNADKGGIRSLHRGSHAVGPQAQSLKLAY
jgi:hypothetical protein